jgi:glyoxylase I family protein
MKLDHVTIRTTDLKETKDFFLKVFDLEEKPRPKVIQRIPGHWLYHNDEPLVHLIGSRGSGQDFAAEAIDHVGIKLEGYANFKKKLEGLSIPFSLMDIPELDERRIFFRTPKGPILEAVFNEKV